VDVSDVSEKLKAIMLTEYVAIKEEQRARIGFRDNLLYATLASYAAVFGFASNDRLAVLFFVPFVGVVLGWAYVVNDEKVSRIGRYVRVVLATRLAGDARGEARVSDDEECAKAIFSWEIFHRNDLWRVPRKLIQCLVDLLAFVVPGLVAMAIVGAKFDYDAVVLKCAIAVEVVALIILGVIIILQTDFGQSGRLFK
jgi:hypothetical protein